MNQITPQSIAGAALVALLILGGRAAWVQYGVPGRVGVYSTVYGDRVALAEIEWLVAVDAGVVLHVPAPGTVVSTGVWPLDGGAPAQILGLARTCAVPVDGGQPPPPGFLGPDVQVPFDQADTDACATTDPPIEIYLDGTLTPDAGFPLWACACPLPVDAGPCLWTQPTGPSGDGGTWTAQSPANNTMDPGTWAGSGCRPMTCRSMTGTPIYPPECQ